MTPLFGPGWGNYAIQGIVETALPAAVSWRPSTPGWWIVAFLGAAWILRSLWRRWQNYRRNQYRREALSALALLRERLGRGDTQALRALAPLLRATAIRADRAADLRSLSGGAWSAALEHLAPELPALPVERLNHLAYAPLPDAVPDDFLTLVDALERWIATHEYRHA